MRQFRAVTNARELGLVLRTYVTECRQGRWQLVDKGFNAQQISLATKQHHARTPLNITLTLGKSARICP